MFRHALCPLLLITAAAANASGEQPPATATAATPAMAAIDDDDVDATKTASFGTGRLDTRASALGAFSARAENDLGWSDKYYTNGIRFAYTTPEIFGDGIPTIFRDALKMCPLAESTATNPAAYRLHIGATHQFYTAANRSAYYPSPDDHPYAGLAYGTFGISSETANRLDVLEVGLGILGPSALAKSVQNGWHSLIGVDRAGGWHTQLHDEALVQFAWTRIGRYQWLNTDSLALDWLPRVRLEAGTVRSFAEIGWQWRLGWSLPKDFGYGAIRDSLALTRPARDVDYSAPLHWKPDAAWIFFDFRGQFCARDSVLDGTIWHGSHSSVHRYPWLGEISVGVAARWGQWSLSIQEVVRTKEFRGQDREVFVFTSASLNVVF